MKGLNEPRKEVQPLAKDLTDGDTMGSNDDPINPLKKKKWVGLFSNSLAGKGMQLNYILRELKEGVLVVKLKLQEI